MTRSRLPLVSGNHVFVLDRAGDQPVPVVVGTDAWYTWLIDQHIQSFSLAILGLRRTSLLDSPTPCFFALQRVG
jgi:hypothetical protein